MILRGTEHKRLLVLVDHVHKQLHAVRFSLLDLDDLVEVAFRVSLPGFNFALNELVVGRIDVLVERGRNLFDLKRREEAVVDAFLERVDIGGLAEVRVSVNVILALWRGGETSCTAGRK